MCSAILIAARAPGAPPGSWRGPRGEAAKDLLVGHDGLGTLEPPSPRRLAPQARRHHESPEELRTPDQAPDEPQRQPGEVPRGEGRRGQVLPLKEEPVPLVDDA